MVKIVWEINMRVLEKQNNKKMIIDFHIFFELAGTWEHTHLHKYTQTDRHRQTRSHHVSYAYARYVRMLCIGVREWNKHTKKKR